MTVTNLDPWLPSRERKESPSLIVMHSTAGSSLNGAIQTLRQEGLGYHYLIEKSGRITKAVPVSKFTYHAGNSYGPEEQAKGISNAQDRRKNFIERTSVNPYSIGISFVNLNDGKDPLTKEQIESAEWVVKQCKVMYQELEWVSTHTLVSPGRKSDPKLFDLDAFAKAVGLKAWRPG